MRGLSNSTKELIQYARGLLAADHPQTLRQLHYAIFSRKEIAYDNCQADYKRLSRATSLARRAHREWELAANCASTMGLAAVAGDEPFLGIPTHWMVDETRQPETVSVWNNAAQYIDCVKRSYRRDNWQDQRNYCEVWSEKATILGAVRPIADKWGVTLRVCHGFGSTGMEGQVGRLFEDLAGKSITVRFLGDHDPSGHVIEQDIHRRVEVASGIHFRMRRLAIHPADILAFHLPPQALKITDSRTASFQKRFGVNAPTVELDALSASELRRRVDVAVEELVDPTLWERQVAVQQVELSCILEFAERIKALPQLAARR
jgi:hypothetical protein